MIYSKMWCVVKPSLGIPVFIAAVAISSFSVHVALTMNTTWVKDFLNGSAKVGSVASVAADPMDALAKK